MKNLIKIFSMLSLLVLAACTDYVQQMKDDHDEWEKENDKYAVWDQYHSSSSVEAVDPSTVKMGSLYDSRDDRKYQTVTIGSQTWMAENLNYKVEDSYCYQEWDLDYCNEYGRLYTWTAAVAKSESECGPGEGCDGTNSLVRGVCPNGWRMPTTEDFRILFDAVGGMEVAGRVLKSSRGWGGNSSLDSYGFGVLPAGMMMSLSSYDYMGEYAYFWTSTVASYGNSSAIAFSSYDMAEINDWMYRGSGLSVRCIEGMADDDSGEEDSGEEEVDFPYSSFDDDYDWSSSSSGYNISSSSISEVADVCGDMWCGRDYIYQVATYVEAGYDDSGVWFDYTDSHDGGASTLEYPVERGNEYSALAFDYIIDNCGGICGSFVLDKGTLVYNPFVGIGFNVAGTDERDKAVPADVSAWGGICVVYSSSVNVVIEMGLGDDEDSALGYDVPFVTMPASATGSVLEYTWNRFKQGGWGMDRISGEDASKALAALKFKFQSVTGTRGNFNIMSVGRYGSCGPVQ